MDLQFTAAYQIAYEFALGSGSMEVKVGKAAKYSGKDFRRLRR